MTEAIIIISLRHSNLTDTLEAITNISNYRSEQHTDHNKSKSGGKRHKEHHNGISNKIATALASNNYTMDKALEITTGKYSQYYNQEQITQTLTCYDKITTTHHYNHHRVLIIRRVPGPEPGPAWARATPQALLGPVPRPTSNEQVNYMKTYISTGLRPNPPPRC